MKIYAAYRHFLGDAFIGLLHIGHLEVVIRIEGLEAELGHNVPLVGLLDGLNLITAQLIMSLMIPLNITESSNLGNAPLLSRLDDHHRLGH